MMLCCTLLPWFSAVPQVITLAVLDCETTYFFTIKTAATTDKKKILYFEYTTVSSLWLSFRGSPTHEGRTFIRRMGDRSLKELPLL